MSTTDSVTGHGTLIQRADLPSPSEANFVTIGQITSGTKFGIRRSMNERTNQQSAGVREKKPGLRELTPIPIEGNYVTGDATQNFLTGLAKQCKDGAMHRFKVLLTNAEEFKFDAYVENFEMDAPMDGEVKWSATLVPSGDFL